MSKKAAKTPKEVSSYTFRDIVLGKVRGYPPWPGMVVDPETVPPAVAKERPTSKKANFYCVRFFPTGDFAWLVAKDISKLQPHEIESYINEPYKKSGELLNGYRVALDPSKWEKEIEVMGQKAVEEAANAEIDELESEPEEEGSTKAKTKKRKRTSEAPPRSKKTPTKTKRNGTKSKATIESEDEGEDGDGDEDERPKSKQVSPPPTKKAKRDKQEETFDEDALSRDPEANKVKEWRHRLQKSFLSNKVKPKDEEMPILDHLFTTVEQYDKMNVQYLSFSKIGKVMRHIAVLESVPRDEEFHFRDRAKALVEKWHQILGNSKPNGADTGARGGANGASTGAKADEGDKAAEEAPDAPKGDEDAHASEEKEADASMDVDAKEDDVDS